MNIDVKKRVLYILHMLTVTVMKIVMCMETNIRNRNVLDVVAKDIIHRLAMHLHMPKDTT